MKTADGITILNNLTGADGTIMSEISAVQWGEDEARQTIESYHTNVADGYGELDAWRVLISQRNRAAWYIDVPRAWQAYRDTLLAEFPQLEGP
jgi:hypothetical protein